MLEFLVAFMIYSFWIGLIGGEVFLLSFRIYFALRHKLPWKMALFVVLVPCSIGYFHIRKQQSDIQRWYDVAVILQFLLLLIGGVLVYYAHYM